MKKELFISIHILTKGKNKGKFCVNIQESGHAGFLVYNHHYNHISFDDNLFQTEVDKKK